jgi:FkbH-like protein
MSVNALITSAEEAIRNGHWGEARRLLRRYYNQAPGLAAAQVVLKHLRHAPDAATAQPLRVALLRSFTVEPLMPLIEASALLEGIPVHLHCGAFNAYAQEILDPGSGLYSFDPRLIFLIVQTRDLLPDIWSGFTDLSYAEAGHSVDQTLASVTGWVDAIRSRSQADVILQTLELPATPSSGILDAQAAEGQTLAIQRFNRELRGIAQSRPGVFVFDYDQAVARFGRSRWFDQHKWNLMRMPIAADALSELARQYAKYVQVLAGKVSKVLAVDLDNTLWGGVIGEDGMEGIQIGPEHPGSAYLNLQRAILDLYNRGVILAICSKNNPDDALEALTRHRGMLLRPHHFAALRINWEDKARNLREIAAELNLGLDSLAFLDDNPAERARIAQEIPEIQVIDLPEDPKRFADTLRDCAYFERLSLSSEDRERGRYYAGERQRREVQQSTGSIEDFYRSLEMEAEIAEAGPESIKRVAQLTQKTNQFNMTTRRYSEPEITAMAADPCCGVYTLRSRDRFGDNGLVGVIIARFNRAAGEIDTFLMSCRVIGRTLETAMLSHVAIEAKQRGLRYLEGWFLPTAKNAPARDFYRSQGFQPVEESTDGKILWRLDLAETNLDWPEWIARKPVLSEVK